MEIRKWETWINGNLANGIQPSVIAKAMMKQGVSSEESYSLVLRCLEGHDDYHYEEPRINIDGNFVKTSENSYEIIGLVDKPLIVVVDNFLSQEECNKIIDISKNKLEPSKIIDDSTGKSISNPARTSKGAGLDRHEHELVSVIDHRIANFMNCPVDNGERLQVMNYQVGDKFSPHFDYFPDKNINKESGGQRTSTLVIYLNDVDDGGSTYFPRINFSVTPRTGTAVYFEYYNSKGQVNPLTLHSGESVKKGEKWIATKWMREHTIK